MAKTLTISQQVSDFINKNHPRFTALEISNLTAIPVRTIRKFCQERGYKTKDAPIKSWKHEKNRNQLSHVIEPIRKIERAPTEYNNISSPYGIATDLHKP